MLPRAVRQTLAATPFRLVPTLRVRRFVSIASPRSRGRPRSRGARLLLFLAGAGKANGRLVACAARAGHVRPLPERARTRPPAERRPSGDRPRQAPGNLVRADPAAEAASRRSAARAVARGPGRDQLWIQESRATGRQYRLPPVRLVRGGGALRIHRL